MNPEVAKALQGMGLADFAQEWKATRKVIAAVPADKGSYSPDPKSMNALDLAWHIASADIFFLEGIAAGQFVPGGDGGRRPESVTIPADVLAYFDSKFPAAAAAVEALRAEELVGDVSFFGMFSAPRVTFLNMAIKHSVHHRGQLAAYLRPMGAKVPGIYGPSGDEPISLPAEAAQA